MCWLAVVCCFVVAVCWLVIIVGCALLLAVCKLWAVTGCVSFADSVIGVRCLVFVVV